jgi:hypothetical protein
LGAKRFVARQEISGYKFLFSFGTDCVMFFQFIRNSINGRFAPKGVKGIDGYSKRLKIISAGIIKLKFSVKSHDAK